MAVNAFYPPGFAGEDEIGWQSQLASIMHIARQVRTSQQIQLARENLTRLKSSLDVEMLEPVAYWRVRATGFYQQFLNNRDWPGFMGSGHATMAEALLRRDGAWGVAPTPVR